MKNKFLYILTIAMIIVSCKKDNGLDSKDLLVYLPGDYASATNTFTLALLHTPLDVTGTMSTKLAAMATREVTADVTLTLTADTSLVGEYNKANNTNCVALPSGAYHIVNPGYLLPFRIDKVEGQDKGVRISSNRGAAFINVTYQYNNIVASEAPITGTLADRTGWTATVSNTTSSTTGATAMLDGNNSTAWRSSNSSTAAKWAIINMGTLQTIKGLQLTPSYVSTNDNPTKITVSISTDSLTWTSQGTWTGTRPATGTTAANPDQKGIAFIAPVQTQYVRLDITAVVSGSRAGIGEVNAVQ